MLNPYILLAIGIAWVASLGWGGVQTVRLATLQASVAKDHLAQSEANREAERLANRRNAGVTDALNQANANAAAASALASKRLRDLSAARSEAASSCRSLDEPAVGIIRDELREELVAEAQRANQVVRQLTALQAYVREVCRPTAPSETTPPAP